MILVGATNPNIRLNAVQCLGSFVTLFDKDMINNMILPTLDKVINAEAGKSHPEVMVRANSFLFPYLSPNNFCSVFAIILFSLDCYCRCI